VLVRPNFQVSHIGSNHGTLTIAKVAAVQVSIDHERFNVPVRDIDKLKARLHVCVVARYKAGTAIDDLSVVNNDGKKQAFVSNARCELGQRGLVDHGNQLSVLMSWVDF
jgi:hypothetical protein